RRSSGGGGRYRLCRRRHAGRLSRSHALADRHRHGGTIRPRGREDGSRRATAVSGFALNDIRSRVEALGPWFHNIDLGGVSTAPDHFLGDYPGVKWRAFAEAIPADLSGRTVLDIGCNAGFYSMQMKRRGADRVLGIDFDDGYLAQARFAAEVAGLDIEFRN